VPAFLAGVKAGCVQLCRVTGVALYVGCDIIWQVTLRISAMGFIKSYTQPLTNFFSTYGRARCAMLPMGQPDNNFMQELVVKL